MRTLYYAFVAAIVAGCSLLSPPQPEPLKAVLSKLPEVVPHDRSQAASLIVLPPTASPAYDTTRMAYSERPYQIGYFRDHEWAEPPAQMTYKLLIETFGQIGSFRSVLSPPRHQPWRIHLTHRAARTDPGLQQLTAGAAANLARGAARSL